MDKIKSLQLVFFVLIFLSMDVQSLEEAPEFQYMCYADLCTFPVHYCSSRQRRCELCTRDLCILKEEINIPLACRYRCMKYSQVTEAPKPTPLTEVPEITQGDLGDAGVAIIYIAVIVTICFLLMVGVLCLCLKTSLKNMGILTSGEKQKHNTDIEDVHVINEEEEMKMLRRFPLQNTKTNHQTVTRKDSSIQNSVQTSQTQVIIESRNTTTDAPIEAAMIQDITSHKNNQSPGTLRESNNSSADDTGGLYRTLSSTINDTKESCDMNAATGHSTTPKVVHVDNVKMADELDRLLVNDDSDNNVGQKTKKVSNINVANKNSNIYK